MGCTLDIMNLKYLNHPELNNLKQRFLITLLFTIIALTTSCIAIRSSHVEVARNNSSYSTIWTLGLDKSSLFIGNESGHYVFYNDQALTTFHNNGKTYQLKFPWK